MGALLGGLAAALAWAGATLCSTRSARAVGPALALGWVMAFGLIALLPLLAADVPHDVSRATTGWLVLSGAANVGGLLMSYRALSTGAVGVVSPIVSSEGGVTALIAVAAGQRMGGTRATALAGVIGGVALVAWRSGSAGPAAGPTPEALAGPAAHPEGEPPPDTPAAPHLPGPTVARAVVWAGAAALTFGVGLYATGRAGHGVPLAWAIAPPRLIGVALITLPLLLRGRLHLPRELVPFAIGGGVLEVAGFLAYAAGAADDVAIAAVMASVTGAVSAGLGRLFFRERLARHQLLGIALVVAAVAVLGAE